MSYEDTSVVLDRESLADNIRIALPDDVTIQAVDGEIRANRSFLSASSLYLANMLDPTKFKEGQSGVADFKLYSKEVVGLVINYFYIGRISCKVK